MQRSARIKIDMVVTIDDNGLDAPKVCESITELDEKTRAIAALLVPNGVLATDPPPKIAVGLTRQSSFAVKRERYRINSEKNKASVPTEQKPEQTE